MFSQNLEIQRTRILLGTEKERVYQEDLDELNSKESVQDLYLWGEYYYGAGIPLKDAKKEILVVVALLLLPVLLTLFLHTYLPLLLIPFIYLFYTFILKNRVISRALSFERDYPTMLVSLSSAIRTGQDPLSALLGIRDLFSKDSEMYKEIGAVLSAIEEGEVEEDAISKFGETISHPDIALFRTAFVLSRREGSSLGPCLSRLTKVTRHRQSFRRKTKASLALQRLSAIGIVVCCLIIGSMQVVMNPKGLGDTWHHPLGQKIMIAGVTIMSIGLVWMSRIGKARV